MTKQSPIHQKQQTKNVNGRSRKPNNININTSENSNGWSNQSTLNQLLTPVQILAETDLQNELDFYATTQFRYTGSNSTPSTPAISSNTINTPNYFEHQATATFSGNSSSSVSATSTPQLNIPVDGNDYAASNPSLLHRATAMNTSNNENHNNRNLNSLSMMLFDNSSQQATDTTSHLLLNHESINVYGRNPPASNHTIPSVMNNMYSSSTTPINSTPTSPITFNQQGSEHYFESNQQDQSTNRFAAMFLSGENSASSKQSTKRAHQQKNQQFRFKKEVVIPPVLKQQQQQQEQHPLNFLLLSKHNMEQEQLAGISPSATKAKGKQSKGKKKAVPKKKAQPEEDQDMSNDDEEDEPVIGDGAQSYSSIGSGGSRSSLTKDDKRRRNTAASARFRIKKKMREQALQSTACQMTDKANRMEQRMHELETEIKWLKALVVEKNESRLEQLVRERPAVSIAFPSPTPSSGSSSAINGSYQHTASNNDEYEEEEEEEEEDYQQY